MIADATFWQGPLDIFLVTAFKDAGTEIVSVTILKRLSIVSLTLSHLPPDDSVLPTPPICTWLVALTNVWALVSVEIPTLTVIVVEVIAVIDGSFLDTGSVVLG